MLKNGIKLNGDTGHTLVNGILPYSYALKIISNMRQWQPQLSVLDNASWNVINYSFRKYWFIFLFKAKSFALTKILIFSSNFQQLSLTIVLIMNLLIGIWSGMSAGEL